MAVCVGKQLVCCKRKVSVNSYQLHILQAPTLKPDITCAHCDVYMARDFGRRRGARQRFFLRMRIVCVYAMDHGDGEGWKLCADPHETGREQTEP